MSDLSSLVMNTIMWCTKGPTWILVTILLITWAFIQYFPVIRYLCDSVLPHYCIIYVCVHGLHTWSTATLRTRTEQQLWEELPQKWIVSNGNRMAGYLGEEIIWQIGGFESNPPKFHLPKTPVWCHRYCRIIASTCTRPTTRCSSLIVGMNFTIESRVRGRQVSKEFWTPEVNARKAILTACSYVVAVKTDAMKTVHIK